MRIAVVTLNPGVDRVVYLGKTLDVGGHNRSTHAVVSQGSKGANQAILLKNLGNEPDYLHLPAVSSVRFPNRIPKNTV